jgi:hypothetical protein
MRDERRRIARRDAALEETLGDILAGLVPLRRG